MIEHILRNKIIKSFNYFSHRLTGIALMLSISLKLTNGMLRITLQTKFSLVNFRKVECKPLIRRFVTLIGSSQRTAFLNFVAGCKVFPQAVQCVDYFWGFLFLANFQTRSENLWADAMDLSLEHIKEQHSSLSWLVAKYFLGQSCMWTIFLVCLFWPVSNHGVKIFEQTQWIFHWNLSKNNTLQFRWCMQSISSGSAVCELFFGFLFLVKIPSTEWKPSSRRFESFTATYQRTTLFNFVSGFKVFLWAAQHVDFFGGIVYLPIFQNGVKAFKQTLWNFNWNSSKHNIPKFRGWMQSNFQFHYYFIDWYSVLVFTVKFNFVHRATHRCRDENACITRAFLSCRDLIGPGQQHNQRNFP